MKIVWKSVVNFEGIYSISNFGDVRRDAGGQGAIANKILKPVKNKKGYLTVSLHKDKKHTSATIASLVAAAFIGPREINMTINHKDGCKTNNKVENLEYVTNLENMQHAWKLGLQKPKIGEKNGLAKLTENEVIKIRREYATGNVFQRPLARKYRVCQRTINMIVNNISWKHI